MSRFPPKTTFPLAGGKPSGGSGRPVPLDFLFDKVRETLSEPPRYPAAHQYAFDWQEPSVEKVNMSVREKFIRHICLVRSKSVGAAEAAGAKWTYDSVGINTPENLPFDIVILQPMIDSHSSTDTSRIEHIIVLMLENRSFDHLVGALPEVDGVDPGAPHSNLEGPGSTTSYLQTATATREMKPDPHHETINVLRQIDGAGLGSMGGFVYDFALEEPNSAHVWDQVMAYFPRGALPALHELATSFCICDPWFSSVPGPTWTNRFFIHSGTSQGWVNMPSLPRNPNLHKYDQKTLYDRLNERGIKWRIYYGDIPQSLLLKRQRTIRNLRNYSRMKNFYNDVEKTDGNGFPAYVFIEPAYLPWGQNDQHPPDDILKGDALIAAVYNAIRANEELWETTLLILTWDEHGGFYDHVQPPEAVPPDGKNQEGFNFDRLGVRVPTVLISKWVTPGSVFKPERGHLDHTSLLRFLSDKWTLGSLGKRTTAAGTFAGALNTSPNSGGPQAVGEALATETFMESDYSLLELNKNHATLIDFTRQLEVEMEAPPADVGRRAIQSATSIEGAVEAAKERVRLFLSQSDLQPLAETGLTEET